MKPLFTIDAQEVSFTRKGRRVEIRRIGEDYFTHQPKLGLFIDDMSKLVDHGDSTAKLKYKAKTLIDAQETQ